VVKKINVFVKGSNRQPEAEALAKAIIRGTAKKIGLSDKMCPMETGATAKNFNRSPSRKKAIG